MEARRYAIALYGALKGQSSEVRDERIGRFLAILEDNNHTRLLPRIVSIIASLGAAERRATVVRITTPAPLSEEAIAALAKQHRDEAGITGESSIVAEVDTSLIGGHIITSRTRRYDASCKTALLRLYEDLRTT